MNGNSHIFSELESDALQEILNVSFGSAASDLADMMDIFVSLNIPRIQVIPVAELLTHLDSQIQDFDDCHVILENYHGEFRGEALLLFPYGAEKELLSYFEQHDETGYESDELIDLEKEGLLEISNMLTGACLGRIFEFLGSRVSYLPPQLLMGREFKDSFHLDNHHSDGPVIILKTGFSFEDRLVTGFLYLLNYKDSIPHLKKALDRFKG